MDQSLVKNSKECWTNWGELNSFSFNHVVESLLSHVEKLRRNSTKRGSNFYFSVEIMTLEEFKIFCKETSIHGLYHIADDTASILKRCLWLGIFLGCLSYAGQQLMMSVKGIHFAG